LGLAKVAIDKISVRIRRYGHAEVWQHTMSSPYAVCSAGWDWVSCRSI